MFLLDGKEKFDNYCKKPNGIIYSKDSVFLHDASLDVSIIVPCYNVSNYISECIESLISQKTDISYEIIVINDGSTDDTLDMIKKYDDDKIYLIDQLNKGISYTRNVGVANSRGKYLIFVDSDDYVSENYVDVLYKKAVSEKADIVGCEYKIFRSDSRKCISRIKVKNQNDIKKMNGCFWGKIFDRNLFSNVLEPLNYWYEDSIVKHIIFPKSKCIKMVNDCYYYYRHNDSGLIRSSAKKYRKIESIYVTDLIVRSLHLFFSDSYIFSQDCFEKIIEQFFLNENRVFDLNEEIKRNVFNCQSAFLKKYYSGYSLKKNFMINGYYKCLIEGNYSKSKFFVKYYKLYQLLNLYN